MFREFPFLQLGGEVALEFVVKEEADMKLGEGREGEGSREGEGEGEREKEGREEEGRLCPAPFRS